MFDVFTPASPFAAQTQRLVARAQFGAADIFEITTLATQVAPGDVAGWEAAWTALAEGALREAEAHQAAHHRQSAMTRYFHAATYYQQSDIFTPGGDPRRAVAFRRGQSAFRTAALLNGRIRVVAVRCGDEIYEGYFCLPPGATNERVPAVLYIGGLDAFSEETYFSGAGILERGMAMLLLDMPGRGSSLYLNGIPARFDYEVPVSAAVDWMVEQPEIDPARIGIAGISLAGYYAPRAAAFEKRFRALACWGGITSIIDDIYDYHPASHDQFRWVTGSADDATTRAALAAYDLTEVAPQITIPTCIVHGRDDRISRVQGAEHLVARIGARDKQLHIMTGPGAGHCNYDDWRHVVPLLFDWLRDQLVADL
jgi:dienelactone hydrolase